MRFFAVHKISSFLRTPDIESFHYEMFHGISARGGVEYPRHKEYKLGDALEIPLSLIKNVFRISEIFCPNTNWVVSSRVQADLRGLPNIAFSKVKFSKIVEYPYYPGDYSFKQDKAYLACRTSTRSEDFLKGLPTSNLKIGEYHELISPRLKDVQREFTDLQQVSYCLEEVSQENRSIAASPALLRKYPILWHLDTFLSEEAFDRIATCLDLNFFYIRELQLR